jgi:hypothetical protein
MLHGIISITNSYRVHAMSYTAAVTRAPWGVFDSQFRHVTCMDHLSIVLW